MMHSVRKHCGLPPRNTYWAIVTPRGRVMPETINQTRNGAWSAAACSCRLWLDNDWQTLRAIGYRAVRVRVRVTVEGEKK